MPKFTPDRGRVTLSLRNDKVSEKAAASSRKNAPFCLFISLGSRVSFGGDVGDSPNSSDGVVQPTCEFACGIECVILAVGDFARPFGGASARHEACGADVLHHVGREIEAAADHDLSGLGVVVNAAVANFLFDGGRGGERFGVSKERAGPGDAAFELHAAAELAGICEDREPLPQHRHGLGMRGADVAQRLFQHLLHVIGEPLVSRAQRIG
jgi:hypothetical protein